MTEQQMRQMFFDYLRSNLMVSIDGSFLTIKLKNPQTCQWEGVTFATLPAQTNNITF